MAGIGAVTNRLTGAEAIETDAPTLVDVVTQPLEEARAPVSEWVA